MALLSHYTTRDGFEGIAKTKTFWATHFLSLNDTSEFFYAWRQLMEAAFEILIQRMPDEVKQKKYDISSFGENATNQTKALANSTDGYGHLYVASFAQGKTEDHNKRGIRTLWELYNGHQGYCLQFEQDDVAKMLKMDQMTSYYDGLEMIEVKYGIDRNERIFRELSFQLSEQLLLQMLRAGNDIRVRPQLERMWPDSELYRRMMPYCASHKDPCFEDERELRIFAFPSASAQIRPSMPIIWAPKQIRNTSAGKKYIVLGETYEPRIVPRRVIIGTKADRDVDSILANYSPIPEVAFADMPVA
jgi:hypothetical protein